LIVSLRCKLPPSLCELRRDKTARQEEVKNTARILKTGRWNVTFPIPQKLFLPEFYFADLEIKKRSADY